MLIFIVSKYLESHKRLVIPQLGTFLVKEPGVSVVFSELMKRDDGVLRGLLRAEGIGELEAAGEIDRFVFEVRHAVEHGLTFCLDGFGVFSPGPNATVAFAYRPSPVLPQNADGSGEKSGASSGEHAGAEVVAQPEGGSDASRAGRPQIRPDKIAEAVEAAFADPHVSPSVKMNPEPYVKGLKYGKPRKTTDAYRYVDRAPRRRVDRFLLVAVIAAAVAVAAIAFGYWRDLREKQAEAALQEQTQPASEVRPLSVPDAAPADRPLPESNQ